MKVIDNRLPTWAMKHDLVAEWVFRRCGLFDSAFYEAAFPDSVGYPGGAIRHYLERGRSKGANPHPLFESVFFLRNATGKALESRDPFLYFLFFGSQECLSPGPLFDTKYYLAKSPDVRIEGVNPLLHYLRHGSREGRDPNPYFSTTFYRESYPRVGKSGMCPLIHYALLGGLEGCDPSPLFSSMGYLRKHSDVARAGRNPLAHFLSNGRKEGRAILSREAFQKVNASRRSGSADTGHHRLAESVQHFSSYPPATKAVRSVREEPERQPMVSIIVLNRNGAQLLDAMLRSFLATNTYGNFEFIVVDHASSDRSLEVVRRWAQLLPLRIIACDENHSFSYSNNRAAEVAAGELLLLLNNDVVFSRDVLTQMVAALEADGIGAVGIKQYLGHPGLIGPHPIHHIGIRFAWKAGEHFLQPYNVRGDVLDDVLATSAASFPAITAAVLLCRRDLYHSVGGLEEGYCYGYEDVDFCFKLRLLAGKETISLNSTFLFHNESTTRNKVASDELRAQRLGNRDLLKRRFGYEIRRDFVKGLFDGDGSSAGRRVSVGIAVTTTNMESGAGDLYTAFGLGEALKNLHGWDVCYLPKDRWYDVTGIDVFIAMRDDVDIRNLTKAAPHILTIAWMRNWLERWAVHPWTELFDVLLCSSRYGIEFIRTERQLESHLFPIAAAGEIFGRGPANPEYEADYLFTGNYWKAEIPREIEEFDPATIPYQFAVYGRDWNQHPRFAPYHKGFLRFGELPRAYNSAKVTIDDTVTHVTKLWGSLNSRVFEALAAGSLVLTNNEIGAAEFFGDELPVWKDAEDLGVQLRRFLSDPRECKARVDSLRAKVLAEHTYEVRARRLSEILDHALCGWRIAIKCPVPREAEAEAWGDYHFARSLMRALTRLGHRVRVDIIPEWYGAKSAGDDVVIVLRGLTEYKPSSDQINLCWLISHPELAGDDELNRYDHVCVASAGYAQTLRTRLSVPVSPLLQCSDPELFHPDDSADRGAGEELLFVGNSRKQDRKVVADCVALGLPVAVYGRDWGGRIPAGLIRGEHIRNSELHRHYGQAKIVLNDHWPDMARLGFISNRIFDVALSGGFLVSDRVAGGEVFEGALLCYDTPEELAAIYRRWGDDEDGRAELSLRLRELVLQDHTFGHRAGTLVDLIRESETARRKALQVMKSHEHCAAPAMTG